MREAGQSGSIVSILCDGGERYAHSYYNPDWYAQNNIDVTASDALIKAAAEGGRLAALDWMA
jgi:cysteine synthase A